LKSLPYPIGVRFLRRDDSVPIVDVNVLVEVVAFCVDDLEVVKVVDVEVVDVKVVAFCVDDLEVAKVVDVLSLKLFGLLMTSMLTMVPILVLLTLLLMQLLTL